jgi:capsular exopolysaccharide synthesis family protein
MKEVRSMGPSVPPTTGRASAPASRVDHLGVIGRHPWLTILVIGWAIGVTALYSFTRPTVYTSEAAVLVRPALTALDSREGEVNPATESQVVDSTAVARLVSEQLEGNPSIPSLLRNVVVDVPENTEILRIQFTAGDPRRAQEGADAFATSYLEFRREQAETEAADQVSRLQASLDVLVPQIDELRGELQEATPDDPAESAARDQLRDLLARRAIIENQLLQAQAVTITPGEVIARALRPRSPSSPNHLLDLALGATVGLGLAFGLAYIRDRRWTGFESAGELERELGIPVSSVIPSLRYDRARRLDPIDLYRSNGPISDAYRTLRTSVLAHAARSRLATIAVTSARPGEGTSTTAAMLAISLASTGHRVVLIEADLRRRASNTLGVEDTAGLADVLAGRVDSVNDTMQATSVPGLSVVPSGWADPVTDPAELLEADRMRKVLEDCGGADFVVIDTPAVLTGADALVLARLADGVLIVASAKGTTPQTVSYAALQLQRMGANVIGAVLVGPRRPEGLDLRYRLRRDLGGPTAVEDRAIPGRPDQMVDRHHPGPTAALDQNRATVASTVIGTPHTAPESPTIEAAGAETREAPTTEGVPVAEGPVGEEPSRSGGASPRREQAGRGREESPPSPGTTGGDARRPAAAPSPSTTPPTRKKPRARSSTSRRKPARDAAPETTPPAREGGPTATTDAASTPETGAADTPVGVTADDAGTSTPAAGASEGAPSSPAEPVAAEESSSGPEVVGMSHPEESSTTPQGDGPGAETSRSLGEADRTPDRNETQAGGNARTPAEVPDDDQHDEPGNGSAEPDSAERSTNRA